MKTIQYIINDPAGIHARPAGMLAKIAMHFKSNIKISKDGQAADAKGILAVMMLEVSQGDQVVINIEGEDEEAAVVAIKGFLSENL